MYFKKRTPLILELGFRKEALPQLNAYVDFLWQSNEQLNLISRQMSYEELIDNHLIDILLPLKKFPAGLNKAADFGSGSGLPAVVYALQFPKLEYSLYEKSPKKQEFLNQCKAFAPNLIICGEIPRQFAGVDIVTARAFKPLDVILQMSRQYYEKDGKYFLLKGRKGKIDEEVILAKKKFKNLHVQIEKLDSPVLDVERHLVLI